MPVGCRRPSGTASSISSQHVIMPSCPPRLGRALEAWGFAVGIAPVDEFLVAGGACRCLTLALDVVVRGASPE